MLGDRLNILVTPFSLSGKASADTVKLKIIVMLLFRQLAEKLNTTVFPYRLLVGRIKCPYILFDYIEMYKQALSRTGYLKPTNRFVRILGRPVKHIYIFIYLILSEIISSVFNSYTFEF
jgi:hypothetical protein